MSACGTSLPFTSLGRQSLPQQQTQAFFMGPVCTMPVVLGLRQIKLAKKRHRASGRWPLQSGVG